MQQRYYDPLIGRFYSNDPVGFTASNPMMFNRYAYANNNPYKFVDPDGNEPISFAPLHPFAQERQIFNDGARLASGAATAAPGFAAEIAVGTTKFVFKHILTPSNISFAAGLFPGVGPFVVSTTFAIVDSVDSETFSNLGGIMAGEIMEKTMETYGKKYPKTAFALKQTASFGASEGIKLHEKEMIKSQQAESNIKMKGKVDVIGSRVESNKNKKNEK